MNVQLDEYAVKLKRMEDNLRSVVDPLLSTLSNIDRELTRLRQELSAANSIKFIETCKGRVEIDKPKLSKRESDL